MVLEAGDALVQTQLVELVVPAGQHLPSLGQEEGPIAAAGHRAHDCSFRHLHLEELDMGTFIFGCSLNIWIR